MSHANVARIALAHRRLLCAAVLATLSGQIVAADASPAADDPAKLARVEVVGSRIKRVDVETAQPVLVLEREQLERTGLISVGDILQQLTVHGAALNTTVNNGGDGTTRIDLRNLGDQRTLVLVDGRRWIPGIDGAADLNSIPLALIERIEVLKDGASAIYGSDAIAGVVNFSTRRDFQGGEARAYAGESAYGDGRVQAWDASYGYSVERTRFSGGLSYQKQAPILAGDREISAVPIYGLPGTDTRAGASQFTPNGLFGFGSRGLCPFNAAGSYPANGRCSAPDIRPLTQNRSTFDPVTGGYRLFDPTSDGYNFAPENYLSTPQRRMAAFANLAQTLGDSTEFSLQLFYNQRESAQKLAPSPILVGSQFSGVSRVTVPADHVYNPFGQPVTGLFVRPGGQNRDFMQDADTWRIAAGIEGVFAAFGRDWYWDLDLVQGSYAIDTSTEGLVDLGRFAQALGPSFRDASGSARCGTPGAVIAGCVPFDPFRGPTALTPEMIDYVYYAGRDRTRTRAWNHRLGISGDLTDLPAGPLALAAGYEYRREQADSRIDARRAALDNLVGTDYGGAVRVDETYLELSIPVLAAAPFAHALDLSLAGRSSDYDSFGSHTTLEGSLRWQPIAELLLRASWSQGFRAPIVSELYFPQGEGLAGLDEDPCTEPNSTPARLANCAADGVPAGAYTPDGVLFRVVTGGNPELQPESALSRGVGAVWSPPALPGFDLALDWFRIGVEDAITPVEFDELLRLCADTGLAAACARTTRSASGELIEIDARQLNSGRLEVEGYDFSAGYAFDSGWGHFDLRLDSTYTDRYRSEVPRGAGERSAVGHLFPFEPGFRLRANLDLAWQQGPWSAAIGLRHYSKLDEPCRNPARYGATQLCNGPSTSQVFPGESENRLGSRTYVDLQGGWEAPWNARVVLGVHNAFDRDPPVSYSAFANSFDPSYPLPGRFWYARYVQQF